LFITFLHSVLLILQLFISDNSEVYNLKIKQFENSLKQKDYSKAYTFLKELDRQSFFINYELEQVTLLLELKSNKSSLKKVKPNLNNAILNSLEFVSQKNFNFALKILKNDIALNHLDTTIKWFEILASNSKKNNQIARIGYKQEQPKKSFNERDALDLLNLMKNKEKYIKYE